MGRGRLYVVAALGLLALAAVIAWRTWSHTSPGQFDPIGAVIALAALAASLVSMRQAVLAQRQVDADVPNASSRLALAVKQAETEARRQLLGGHDRTIDVGFTFQTVATHKAVGVGKQGTLEEIVIFYRNLRPRRMVITGPAGSGKTVLAMQLILGLLEGWTEGSPVPVRLSAALLDTSRPPESAVSDWLIVHLKQAYGLSDFTARQLVSARAVLPILDGLDEMDAVEQPGYASRAGQAIRACNAYLDGDKKAALVLTCRIGQYETLEQAHEWVQDAARVQISPVGLSAARNFLTRRVIDKDRWQPVLKEMKRPTDQPLADALSTPWRLTLAATVYDQRDPDTGAYVRNPVDLTNSALDTADKIRDHLLGLFFPAAIAVHHSRYTDAEVHRWLGVLAVYLEANTATAIRPARVIAGRTLSSSDLILHELWPLAGPRLPRVLTAAVPMMAGIAFAIIEFIILSINGLTDILLALGVALMPFAIAFIALPAWPAPRQLDLRQLQVSGIRRLLAGITVGIVSGGGLGIWAATRTGLGAGIASGLAGGLAGILAFIFEFGLNKPGKYSATEPREILLRDFVIGAVGGYLAGIAGTLGGWFVLGLGGLFPLGLTVALLYGFILSTVFGLASWRYLAFLLCTRFWSIRGLPWRLGEFLHWCYLAGLIRVAGIGYQFRHRELQAYLARNPTPPA
jgi:hypothetical protein